MGYKVRDVAVVKCLLSLLFHLHSNHYFPDNSGLNNGPIINVHFASYLCPYVETRGICVISTVRKRLKELVVVVKLVSHQGNIIRMKFNFLCSSTVSQVKCSLPRAIR